MKKIFVLPHGKSDWGNAYQHDFDRALNHRGILDAKNMGDHLKNYSFPDSIISSSAKRAITTAHLLAQQLNFNEKLIVEKRNLYLAPINELMETIKTIDNKVDNLYLIGHNPGLTSLVSYLTDDWMELKTCCVAILESEIDSWENWIKGVASINEYISPKSI